MRRLPAIALGGLVAATIGAFFFTQHLKVTTPLIAGDPRPDPAVINPVGTTCGGVDHRRARLSFYLLHRADDVDVYVVDQTGAIVRTLAVGRHMRRGVRRPDGEFAWNGREDNGSTAPDGQYHFRVALLQQGRTIDLTAPVTVTTAPPRPVVTSVSPSLIPQRSMRVLIRYTGNEHRRGTVLIYRTDAPGKPRLVKSFLTAGNAQSAVWDGLIRRGPAPAGTYLVGLEVTDAGCNTGRFPAALPPAPGTTPHAGVTVRYLAAEPSLTPAPAGSRALVYVDARRHPYHWSLVGVGGGKPIASGTTDRTVMRVSLPPTAARLYELSLSSGARRTVVPVIARSTRPERVLVVLPALTWEGLNPVDDTGEGLPSTLEADEEIRLDRPLVNGLPPGFADEAGLLSYLDSGHRSYDLTTDVALIDRTGPRLAGHTLVVLAGSERWLPGRVAAQLRRFVEAGGHVLSLGLNSMRSGVTVRDNLALNPTPPTRADALGAVHGPLISGNHDPIVVIGDQLGIFSNTSGPFSGFTTYEPVTSVAAPGQIVSEAGVASSSPSIVAYSLGRGTVVDIGLQGFGASLAKHVEARNLVSRLWDVLG